MQEDSFLCGSFRGVPDRAVVGYMSTTGWLIVWYLFRVTAFKYWFICTQKRSRVSLRAGEEKETAVETFDVTVSRAVQLRYQSSKTPLSKTKVHAHLKMAHKVNFLLCVPYHNSIVFYSFESPAVTCTHPP